MDGQENQALNQKEIEWYSGFSGQCRALAKNAQQWGVLSADAIFTPFSAEILEPKKYDYEETSYADDQLIPMIDKERRLVYIKPNGEPLFRFKHNAKGKIVAESLKGKLMWETHISAPEDLERQKRFFQPDPVDLGVKPALLNNTKAIIAHLETLPLKYFSTEMLSYEDEFEAGEEQLRGRAILFAHRYINESGAASFAFLEEQKFIGQIYDKLISDMKQELGEPLEKEEKEAAFSWTITVWDGDEEIWRYGDQYLGIAINNVYGDGEYSRLIVVGLLPEQQFETE